MVAVRAGLLIRWLVMIPLPGSAFASLRSTARSQQTRLAEGSHAGSRRTPRDEEADRAERGQSVRRVRTGSVRAAR